MTHLVAVDGGLRLLSACALQGAVVSLRLCLCGFHFCGGLLRMDVVVALGSGCRKPGAVTLGDLADCRLRQGWLIFRLLLLLLLLAQAEARQSLQTWIVL